MVWTHLHLLPDSLQLPEGVGELLLEVLLLQFELLESGITCCAAPTSSFSTCFTCTMLEAVDQLLLGLMGNLTLVQVKVFDP